MEDHEHGVICQGLEILFCLYSCAIFLQHQEERLVCQHQGILDLENKVSDASAITCSHRAGMGKTHITHLSWHTSDTREWAGTYRMGLEPRALAVGSPSKEPILWYPLVSDFMVNILE